MDKKIFVANVRIAVLAENDDEACDAMSAALTENLMQTGGILDWQYLSEYGDFTNKGEYKPKEYEEGD